MADRNVTIRISASDQFSDVFRRYERAAQGAGRATEQVGRSVQQQQGLWSQLSTQVRGAAAAFGLMGVIRVGSDMMRLGQQVTATRAAFERLSGGALAAADNLEMMRVATRGGADDLTLMSGANRLLMMNLARSGEEAARLTQIAVTLGRVMGQDAGQAIESFSLMLSNRSIPRLDNFGISASAVRLRIQELKEAGMGLDEAFTLAVLEQGDLAMTRLGDAVEETVTAVDRLEVSWSNFWAGASENVATGVNLIVESIDRLVSENPEFWQIGTNWNYVEVPRAERGWAGDRPGGGGRRGDARRSDITDDHAKSYSPLEISAFEAGKLETVFKGSTDLLKEAAEALLVSASSLRDITGGPRYGGAGGEGISEIAALIEDEDERAEFLRRTGQTPWGEDMLGNVFQSIANLPVGQRETAAAELARLLNEPGFDIFGMTEADVMGALGYMQGGTTGAGTFATVTPYGGPAPGGTTTAFQEHANQLVEEQTEAWLEYLNESYGIALESTDVEGLVRGGVEASFSRDAISQALAPQIAEMLNIPYEDLGPGNSIWENPQFMSVLTSTVDRVMAAGSATVASTTGGTSTTVSSGSTLSEIAARNNMTVDELMALNPGVDPYRLQVGQQIRTSGPTWGRIAGPSGPEEQGDGGFGLGDTATEAAMADPYAVIQDQMTQISTDATTWREAMTVVDDTVPGIVEPISDISADMPEIASAGSEFAGYCEEAAGSAEDLQAALETMAEDIWRVEIELTGPDAATIRALVGGGAGGSVSVGGGGGGGGGTNWRDGMAIVNGDSGGVPPGSTNTGGPVGGSPLMPGL